MEKDNRGGIGSDYRSSHYNLGGVGMRLSIKIEKGMENDYNKFTDEQRERVKHKASVRLSEVIVEVKGSR